MKWLVFLGSILGTMAAFLAACFAVAATLIWLVRQWGAAAWVVWVGGHIQEGGGKMKVGKSLVLNPGMGNVLVDLEKGKVGKVKFLK